MKNIERCWDVKEKEKSLCLLELHHFSYLFMWPIRYKLGTKKQMNPRTCFNLATFIFKQRKSERQPQTKFGRKANMHLYDYESSSKDITAPLLVVKSTQFYSQKSSVPAHETALCIFILYNSIYWLWFLKKQLMGFK